MAKTGGGFRKVLRPFLQLAILSDLEREEMAASLFKPFAEFQILLQHGRRSNTVCEQVPDDRHVHRRGNTHCDGFAIRADEVILWRDRRSRNQPISVWNQPSKHEKNRTFHQWICMLAQPYIIAGKLVVLP